LLLGLDFSSFFLLLEKLRLGCISSRWLTWTPCFGRGKRGPGFTYWCWQPTKPNQIWISHNISNNMSVWNYD
jgi:hypothetical protein